MSSIIGSIFGESLSKDEALLDAVRNQNVSKVKRLIEEGANIECENKSTYSYDYRPMHSAASRGYEDMVRLLFEKGALPDIATPIEKVTPLHCAVKSGHLNIVKFLVNEAKVPIDPIECSGFTPLSFAADNKNEDIAKFLIENGANIDLLRYEYEKKFINKVIIKYDLDKLISASNSKFLAYENLLEAARKGDLQKIQEEIKKGTPIEFDEKICRDENKNSPIHYAAMHGHGDVVLWLLENGSSPTTVNVHLQNALHCAAGKNRLKVAQILIKYKECIDKVDRNGNPPLYYAVAKLNKEIVELLVDNGADIKCLYKIFYSDRTFYAKKFILEILEKYPDKNIKPVEPEDFIIDLKKFILDENSKHYIEDIDYYSAWKYIDVINSVVTNENNIRQINLNECLIGDKGLKIIGLFIEKNKSLISLELEKNNITCEGLIDFSQSLYENRTLLSINLHYNNIRDTGANAFANSIEKHPALLYINLQSNPILEIGCLAILNAIEKRGIKYSVVNLSDPHIDNELYGEMLFSKSSSNNVLKNEIKHNQVTINKNKNIHKENYFTRTIDTINSSDLLQDLCLKNNDITDADMVIISEKIQGSKIISMDLEENWISNRGLQSLILALDKNEYLSFLNISKNLITSNRNIEELASVWCGSNISTYKQRANNTNSLDISCNYIVGNTENSFKTLLSKYLFLKSDRVYDVKSKINSALKITRDTSLVYLAYHPKSDHAVIFLEGMEENGQLFLERFDFKPKSADKISNIGVIYSVMGEVGANSWSWINVSKSLESLKSYSYDGWESDHSKVNNMRSYLKNANANADESYVFNLTGIGGYNCLTWAMKQIEKHIGITVRKPLLSLPRPSLVVGLQNEEITQYWDGNTILNKTLNQNISDFEDRIKSGKIVELRRFISPHDSRSLIAKISYMDDDVYTKNGLTWLRSSRKYGSAIMNSTNANNVTSVSFRSEKNSTASSSATEYSSERSKMGVNECKIS